MNWGSISLTVWGAAQASISILLIMTYGYAGKAYSLYTDQGVKAMSKLTTTILLPALFFSEIGPHASLSHIIAYWPIIIFSLLEILLGYLYASAGRQVFKSSFLFPRWIIPACMFNNAITLPVLLLDCLRKSQALAAVISPPDNIDKALSRAKTYVLLNALVISFLKFAIGPKLMNPDLLLASTPTPATPRIEYEGHHEETPLVAHQRLYQPPTPKRSLWTVLKAISNPPLLGAITAFVVGIIPILHRYFLDENGILSGTVTQSINKLGNTYAAIQVLVLGAQLFQGTQGEFKKPLPKLAITYILLFRFAFMPIISITCIYTLRNWRPDFLLDDPMFDFALMIAPMGPPSVTLGAVAELAHLPEDDIGLLARMMMIAYFIAPLTSLPVALALTLVGVNHAGSG